jgi:hypothetical protein
VQFRPDRTKLARRLLCEEAKGWPMPRLLCFAVFAFAFPELLCCQESGSGMMFSARYAASFVNFGQVHRLDASAGYRFNDHFTLAAGIPFYLVRSSTTLAGSASTSASGIGNAYLNVNVAADTALLRYWSVASATAPTGDKSKGFSTGRATIDWTNGFSKDIGRLTPFLSLGVANAITDSPFWVRPFSTLGLNAHAEGGGIFRIREPVSIGASAYAVMPSGEQKVYSKVVPGQTGQTPPGQMGGRTPAAQGVGAGRGSHGVFETSSVTVGDASIAKDHGFSAWLTARLSRHISFVALYSRSTTYSLDSFSTGIGIDIGSLIKTRRL